MIAIKVQENESPTRTSHSNCEVYLRQWVRLNCHTRRVCGHWLDGGGFELKRPLGWVCGGWEGGRGDGLSEWRLGLVLLALQYGLATEVLNCIEEPLTWPSGLLGENKGSAKSVVIITAACGYHPIWRIRSRMIALE